MSTESDSIKIKGARVNNLKNIDVEIPRGKFVVITGLSGSGKSSLAFDTLYAEGQRRYVESLSAYARQFLGRMQKPECDSITGIPPAIAIEQKVTSRNPRSTVGTTTEIYEYLRLLYARIGRTFSPISGEEVKKQGVEDVVRCLSEYSEGTKFMVMCRPKSSVETLKAQGFQRFELDGDDILLVVDRLTVAKDKESLSRLTDSVETAFYEGGGEMLIKVMPAGITHTFSTRFEADGITFMQPSDQLFAFNSPLGACPECEGYGRIIGIDESLVIPDTSRSVYDGAVMCWRGEKLGEWKTWFIRLNSERGFPVHKPYYQLTQAEKDWLWHGKPSPNVQWKLSPEEKEWGLVSIDAFFESLRQAQYKIQNRVMLARYRGKAVCPRCRGTRLRPEASYVKVGGKAITELVEMPVSALLEWFRKLTLTPTEEQIAQRLLTEITSRLSFLIEVGLPYLTLSRLSNSLSGGESQRINLASSLGSALVGSLYILDEPSIGLHSRDTERLIHVLKELRDLGNTVVVVEHDEDIIRAADWVIDIGPEAGRLGGKVVFCGAPDTKVHPDTDVVSHTLDFLLGRDDIPVPTSRRPWNRFVEIRGARANNLKGINVRIPLNVMTCVTGVSGSGKSSLVRDIFYNGMRRELDMSADRPGEFQELTGDKNCVRSIEFVDQNPIGKSTRSNPVTYVKAWDEIRRLLASQPLAEQMEFTPAHFSFNAEGGRCEECKGEGTITVEMQFMADLVLECESCHGKRFKPDVLEVRFEGKNVFDILNMTINQAIEFFTEHGQKKIVRLLRPLQDVGLGYIKLGQSSSTLSGGENQRVKLAYYLGLEKVEPTVFIFDEPTTGLHHHDIKRLLQSFDALIQKGHTILIIEHNMDVIKTADWVIDLGPEGGREGGNIVAEGTPETIAETEGSYTGRYLKEKL
jgi:excinuclease ABC subunit A